MISFIDPDPSNHTVGLVGQDHGRRIKAEEKAKVAASVWE